MEIQAHNDLSDIVSHIEEKISLIKKFLNQNQETSNVHREELDRCEIMAAKARDDLSTCERALTVIKRDELSPTNEVANPYEAIINRSQRIQEY